MASKAGFKDDRHERLLLVEENNDCHVVLALCQKHNVPKTFDVFDSGSEDFCCTIADERVLGFAKQCVEESQKKGFSGFKKVHTSKAEIHTYLAWQNEPGMPLGLAITAQVLDGKHELAKTFSQWLKELFKEQ